MLRSASTPRARHGEEFPCPQLSSMIWVVAETIRRQGDLDRAANWYLTLANMPETNPTMREEIRAKGKFPSLDAPAEMRLAGVQMTCWRSLLKGRDSW